MHPPCGHCGQTTTHLSGCPVAYNREVARRASEILAQQELSRHSAAQKHVVTSFTRAGGTFPAFTCSCGWEVTCAYLVGLSEFEIRDMVDAHLAGGQVGPMQAKFRFPIPFHVACFNCLFMPDTKVGAIQRRILEACCDGEVRVMPRRRFVLAEEA